MFCTSIRYFDTAVERKGISYSVTCKSDDVPNYVVADRLRRICKPLIDGLDTRCRMRDEIDVLARLARASEICHVPSSAGQHQVEACRIGHNLEEAHSPHGLKHATGLAVDWNYT